MTDRWNERDLPVLRAIVAAFDIDEDDGSIPTSYSIAQTIDLPQTQVERAAENLARGGYVDITQTFGGTMFNDITERALREVGIWPTPETALERMIAALEEIAENNTDEDTRTRARKILDGLTAGGKTIGLSVAAAAITGQLPGQ